MTRTLLPDVHSHETRLAPAGAVLAVLGGVEGIKRVRSLLEA